jgi:hypothetical protein
MVVAPIGPGLTSGALRALFFFVPQLYKQGPGSITPSIYWYRAGTYTQLPYQVNDDDTVDFSPPASFAETVLDREDAGE